MEEEEDEFSCLEKMDKKKVFLGGKADLVWVPLSDLFSLMSIQSGFLLNSLKKDVS